MSQILSTLENGLTLFNDNFWRGMGCMLGFVPVHELPVFETDNVGLLEMINRLGGFGIGVTRGVNPGFMSYQRGIDGVTYSPWSHAFTLIGQDIGNKIRIQHPALCQKHPSFRHPQWNNGHPPVMIEGIPPVAERFEIVESQIQVAVSTANCAIDKGEQVIIFVNPQWTEEQRLKMAYEAYTWVGEPYDVPEIAHWVIPIIPNPSDLKACSSLTAQIISAGDPGIIDWSKRHGLDIQSFAPRDVFAYCSDWGFNYFAFKCKFEDALKA